ASASDPELVERFVRQRDSAAFEALVQKYGSLVLRVCIRVLGDHHAAEDAFQATFLVLAQKAGSIRHDSVAGWLYRVAYHIALRARSNAAQSDDRADARSHPSGPDPALEASKRELCAALTEEVSRLPTRLHGPVVLCYVDGLTRDVAAQRLGCSLRTLQRQLRTDR